MIHRELEKKPSRNRFRCLLAIGHAAGSSMRFYSTKRPENRSTRRTRAPPVYTARPAGRRREGLPRVASIASEQQRQSLDLENVGVDRPDLLGRLYGDLQGHSHVAAAGRGPDRIIQV